MYISGLGLENIYTPFFLSGQQKQYVLHGRCHIPKVSVLILSAMAISIMKIHCVSKCISCLIRKRQSEIFVLYLKERGGKTAVQINETAAQMNETPIQKMNETPAQMKLAFI